MSSSCVPAQEWPTRVDAMEAVCADWSRSDETTSGSRRGPPTDGLLGLYITRRSGSGSRPYRTVLHGVDPIEGRCNCPDFLKNSLGLCKHVLVGAGTPPHPTAALAAGDQGTRMERRFRPEAACRWDPIRPLTGIGDWLDRVEWKGDFEAAKARSSRVAQAARWFRANQ